MTVIASFPRVQKPANFPSRQTSDTPAWHAGYLKLLPAIRSQLRFAFRYLATEARQEAIQEGLASTLVAYRRLVQQGRAEIARPSPLANYAVRQFFAGRLTGNRLNVRDLTSTAGRLRHGFTIERLDRWDDRDECWQEVLVEDRSCTPAELAASRIDFAAWLATLSARDRKIAKLLASGHSTSEVSEATGLSWARISQKRRELKDSWDQFHESKEDNPTEHEPSVSA